MPTPPIHAPAWIFCRLSKCVKFNLEMFRFHIDFQGCRRDDKGPPGSREKQTHNGSWLRYAQLATPGGRLAPASIHLHLPWHGVAVEHLPLWMTSMSNQSTSRSLEQARVLDSHCIKHVVLQQSRAT